MDYLAASKTIEKIWFPILYLWCLTVFVGGGAYNMKTTELSTA